MIKLFITANKATHSSEGLSNSCTYQLCAHTKCKGNNKAPLFCTWPVEGILSQYQSREHIQALLTVFFVRNYSFLDGRNKNSSSNFIFMEKLSETKSSSLFFYLKIWALVTPFPVIFYKLGLLNQAKWIQNTSPTKFNWILYCKCW